MTLDGLIDRVERLAVHDASMGLALLELVRQADGRGFVERGDWVTAVRTALARHRPDEPIIGYEAAELEDSAAEIGRYLGEHVLPRAAAWGVITAEPRDEGWVGVELDPELSRSISRPWSTNGVARLEDAVRNLLHGDARSPIQDGEPTSRRRGTLSARSLVKVYRKRRVVDDVSLSVAQGETVGLLGPNGAGKTTTFYMIVGLIRPNRGQVFLDDIELTGVPMYKRASRGIGYLAQEPSVFRKLTVEENIRAILETMDLDRKARSERLEMLLDELTLKHLRDARAYSLSGGERRRLEITRALVTEPKFMLLDEPFAGVDPIAVHDIQQIVGGLRHRGIGVIITDHNVEQTLEIVDRAYIMYDGRVRVSGTVAELVWNEDVAEIYFGPTLTARMRARYPEPEKV